MVDLRCSNCGAIVGRIESKKEIFLYIDERGVPYCNRCQSYRKNCKPKKKILSNFLNRIFHFRNN
jgi:hypothetical protein